MIHVLQAERKQERKGETKKALLLRLERSHEGREAKTCRATKEKCRRDSNEEDLASWPLLRKVEFWRKHH